MGFLDKAKQLAEQAQTKLDSVQADFNQRQSGPAPSGPAVEYDEHGRRVPPAADAPAPAAPAPAAPPPAAPAPAAPDAPVPPAAAAPVPPAPSAAAAPVPPAPADSPGAREYAPPKLSAGDPLSGA